LYNKKFITFKHRCSRKFHKRKWKWHFTTMSTVESLCAAITKSNFEVSAQCITCRETFLVLQGGPHLQAILTAQCHPPIKEMGQIVIYERKHSFLKTGPVGVAMNLIRGWCEIVADATALLSAEQRKAIHSRSGLHTPLISLHCQDIKKNMTSVACYNTNLRCRGCVLDNIPVYKYARQWLYKQRRTVPCRGRCLKGTTFTCGKCMYVACPDCGQGKFALTELDATWGHCRACAKKDFTNKTFEERISKTLQRHVVSKNWTSLLAVKKNNTPLNEKKIYLQVSYADKDEAKSLGAKWDALEKKWYAVNDHKPNTKKLISLYKPKE